jgi:ankyrin repeat protein
LHHATAKDDYHTAKLLLKNGANTNIKNKQEQTPKDLVSEKSKFNSTFSLLFRENNLKKGKKSRPRSKIPSKSGSYAENVKKPDSESRNR